MKYTKAILTAILFVLIGISAFIMHLNSNYIGNSLIEVTYSISLSAFLISAFIYMLGVLFFDIFYFKMYAYNISNKILLTIYFIVIYIIRIFLSLFLIYNLFNFYLINSNRELSTNLTNLCFYIFPLICPIAVGILQFVYHKIACQNFAFFKWTNI